MTKGITPSIKEALQQVIDLADIDASGRSPADLERNLKKIREIALATSMYAENSPLPRVLITVSGGVADYVCDKGVDVEVFDYDSFEAGEGNLCVSERFRDLVEPSQSLPQQAA